MMFRERGHPRRSFYRAGDVVEIRSEREILATLDSDGKLDGVPFMPEMAHYCGRRFRVYRRADKVFLDHHFYVGRLKGTVLLEGVRCDGASHGGCQMGCLTFWKEAWLKPLDPAEATADTDVGECTPPKGALPAVNGRRSCRAGDRYGCQATELIRATSRLPWWDVRQYVRDVTSGNMTIGQLGRMLLLLGNNMLRRIQRRERFGAVHGEQEETTNGRLNLQQGELVEVKSKSDIEATLDKRGRTRGLGFAPEMLNFCGRRFRVASRVERIIIEWTGQMRPIADTVILEGVTCDGASRRGCPRDCYQLWREAWLKRVT
jgi:hypothetical protein